MLLTLNILLLATKSLTHMLNMGSVPPADTEAVMGDASRYDAETLLPFTAIPKYHDHYDKLSGAFKTALKEYEDSKLDPKFNHRQYFLAASLRFNFLVWSSPDLIP
jgi:hypothetical protein